MEEEIRTFCFGQQLILNVKQMINLQPFISKQQIKKLKLASTLVGFEVNLEVLHACLYYLVSVEKMVSCLTKMNFRQKCLSGLQSYYIQQKMNFQLYQYGYFCSKILSYSLQKSLHIIYYLMYERLASKPYIINLINQNRKVTRSVRRNLRKKTCRTNIDEIAFSKDRDSRHMTFFEDGQDSVQKFKKDLKKILSSQPDLRKSARRYQNKRYFNARKRYKDQESQFKFDQLVDEIASSNDSGGRIINIPVKVGPHDHSSVIKRFKIDPRVTSLLQNNDKCKNMMRRQKFREDFNGSEKYKSVMKNEKQQTPKQLKTINIKTMKSIRDEKICGSSNVQKPYHYPYEYFRDVAKNIKINNQNLDLNRAECMRKMEIIRTSLSKQQEGHVNSQLVSKNEDDIPNLMTRSQISLLSLTKLTFQDKQNILGQMKMRQQVYKTGNFPKNQYVKVMSEITPRVNDTLNCIITRDNERVSQQEQQLPLFSRNVEGKHKLKKYKQQYRNFLKNQLFSNIKSQF